MIADSHLVLINMEKYLNEDIDWWHGLWNLSKTSFIYFFLFFFFKLINSSFFFDKTEYEWKEKRRQTEEVATSTLYFLEPNGKKMWKNIHIGVSMIDSVCLPFKIGDWYISIFFCQINKNNQNKMKKKFHSEFVCGKTSDLLIHWIALCCQVQ